MNEIKITNKEKPEIILEVNRLMMDSLDDKKAYDITFSSNPSESIIENKQTYTWTYGTYDTFYRDLKAGLLNPIDHYNIYNPSAVIGDGIHPQVIYDVVYINGTDATLCMHNVSNDSATLHHAKSLASSYIPGGYIPILAQVGKWYCNKRNIILSKSYSQLIKYSNSGSTKHWWTSTQYDSSTACYIDRNGNINTLINSYRNCWVCAFNV